jgi:hypothetical protein
MIELRQDAVASDGNFEEHPESYRPRVFVNTWNWDNPPTSDVYELLTTGQAIPWPSLPKDCGFDYWTLSAPGLGCVKMVRHKKPELVCYDGVMAPACEPIYGPNGQQLGSFTRFVYEPESRVGTVHITDHLPEGSH